jgi:cell division protein FtsI/penicillin-binding protein 2/cell division protein FtsW (lipid II flippase)
MTMTRQTAALRLTQRREREARGSAAFRLRELILLLIASLTIGMGLWLVWSAKTRTFTAANTTDLNTLTSAQQLLPLLNFVPGNEDRDFIAHHIFAARGRHFANAGSIGNIRITAKEIAAHPRLETFPKRIVLAEERESKRKKRMFAPEPGPASVSLLTPEQIRTLKPSVVVRSPAEFRRAFLLWTILCFVAFYAVHIVWRVRGFAGDNTILPVVHLLSGTGLILMVSLRDPLRDTLMFQDFAQGMILGCAFLLACSLFDYEREFKGLSYVWLGLSVLLALALGFFGTGPGESDAKVNLFFFQPVEVIRILLVLFLAGYFARNWDALRDLRQHRGLPAGLASRFHIPRLDYVLPVVIGVGVAVLMFFLLKDMGPALVIGCLFLALYSVARNRAGLAIAGVCTILFIFWFAHTMGYPETVTQRIAMRGSPWDNYVRGGDQLAHSLWALASGGIFGAGIGLGSPEYVPAAHTDLIVSALGEEWGLAGILGVYILYGLLLYKSLRIALRATGVYSFFLVVGLTMVTALQILLITGGLLGVIPLSGVVSPFLSFGRSSMAANFALFGIILAVSNKARGNQTPRFGPPVAWLGYLLGFAFLGLMSRAAYIQIREADDIAARPALVVQSSGPRQYEYNPRLTQLARELPKGEIMDRNGLPLASSDWRKVNAHRADYAKLGIALEPTAPAKRRFYPLGPKMFYLLGDVLTRRKQGAANTAFQERASRIRLQGFDDYAELELAKDEKSGETVRRVRYDYRDLVPLLRHKNEPNNPAVKDIMDRNRDVRMSIDARLQMRASAILEAHLHQLGKDKGSVVVLDPDTGDTLAAVSYPWPAPAEFLSLQSDPAVDINDEQLQDRARYGLYPPGSSFKVVTAIAALRKDPGLAHQRYECVRLPDGRAGNFVGKSKRPIRDDVQDRNPHGSVDMEHGIEVSCNAYFAQLGAYKVGARGLFDTAALFGIQTANPNKPEKLRENLPQASYGQGQVVVSPFQMARVAATVANGGSAPLGRWVIDDSNPRTREATRVLPPELANQLAGFMREVVTVGTGKMLAKSTVPIAGKTGTAELANATSHAWFIGFAPYGPRTGKRIAFSVLVENGQYGGTASAPIAGEIVEAARALGIFAPEAKK